MNVFITGSAFFAAIVILHLAGWRLFRVQSAPKLLVVLTGAAVLASPLVSANLSPLEIIYVDMLFTSLAMAYLLTLPAIESDSPSSIIVLHVHRTGAKGCSKADLRAIVTDEKFVLERLDGLLAQGHVREEDGRYFITERGSRFLGFFMLYHAVAGRAQMGG